MASGALYAGIEGGGTKFVCAVARSPMDLLESTVIPTAAPRATLAECVRFLRDSERRHGPIASIGISCFGPLQLRRKSAGFGRILSTPKPGGGVMSDGTLVPLVREAMFKLLNGYIPALADPDAPDAYVCAPSLGAKSGIAGALLLAREALPQGESAID